jgi:hypothetical protein
LHCTCSFQFGKRIGTIRDRRVLAPAPDSAQLRGLIGIGVKEAQAARGCGSSAGLAAFGQGFAARVRVILSHRSKPKSGMGNFARDEESTHLQALSV